MTTRGRFASLALLAVAAVAASASLSGCIIDDGGNGPGSCQPDLLVDWQLVDANGVPITCAGAGVVTVQATVNGTTWTQNCLANESADSIDVPLGGTGTYHIAVDALDAAAAPRETSQQSIDLNVNSCGTSETPSPAILTISN